MALLSFSWLEHSQKSLTQAVHDWNNHRDIRALEGWLASSNRHVGDTGSLTPELMREFVGGVLQCNPNAVQAYYLPLDWPRESVVETQMLRDIMLDVPAWKQQAEENVRDSDHIGITNLLFPTQSIKEELASNMYSPGTEAGRIHLGMPLNPAWWQRLPMWDQAKKDAHQKSNGWEHLMKEVVARPHPMQGLHIALISQPVRALMEEQQKNLGADVVFVLPTVEQVLNSAIVDKAALAMWQALHCPRDAVPDPKWWTQWDQWCQDDPHSAQLALASMLLDRTTKFEHGNEDDMLQKTLVRLVSLRNPPESYSIASLFSERKKYAHLSVDELVQRCLPIEPRVLHFFEGLASTKEQLVLHYQTLLQPQHQLGMEDLVFDGSMLSDHGRQG